MPKVLSFVFALDVHTKKAQCQGRDHGVNVQSGRQSLVIVNVHFEPELKLRQLRERLRLINPPLARLS